MGKRDFGKCGFVRRMFSGLFSGLLFGLLLLSGCGRDGSGYGEAEGKPGERRAGDAEGAEDAGDAADAVTLEIYAWQDEEDNVEALAAGYMALNANVVIHANFVPVSEYPQRMMSLRGGESQADCLFFPTPSEAAVWQNKGMLMNLEQRLEQWDADEACGDWCREGEECGSYMVPYRMSRWAVYYNKDLFDRRGVPYPQEDWTWEDYERTAVQLTKQVGGDKSYGSLSFAPTSTWWRVPARTGGANDPFLPEELEAFREAARWCYRLTYELGAQLPYTEQTGKAGNSYDANFLEGDTGMYFSGDWSVASLNKMIEQEGLEIRYDVAPMPHWEGEEGQVISDAAVVAVMSDTEYPEAAWDFIRFAAGPQGAAILAGRSVIPAYCPEEIREIYLSSEQYPEHREYFFAEGKPSRTPANGRYIEAMEIIKEEVAHYLLQEQSLDQAFAAIEEGLKEIQEE